jgi:hypothetical protein
MGTGDKRKENPEVEEAEMDEKGRRMFRRWSPPSVATSEHRGYVKAGKEKQLESNTRVEKREEKQGRLYSKQHRLNKPARHQPAPPGWRRY